MNFEVYTIVLMSSGVTIGASVFIILIIKNYSNRLNKNKEQIFEIINKHEKEILNTRLEIQENTFTNISKEIHDNISLGLTLAKLQLNNELSKTEIDRKKLESSIDLISKSLIDLNDLSKSLDANSMLSHGLISAIESELLVINRSGIIDASMEVIGEGFFLPTETELILLRIFQESVNNIIKHAKASKIEAWLLFETNSLELKIIDNGKGFDVAQTLQHKTTRKMSGLTNIRNRAQMIGSTVNFTSVPNIGTTISIKTPIKSP